MKAGIEVVVDKHVRQNQGRWSYLERCRSISRVQSEDPDDV